MIEWDYLIYSEERDKAVKVQTFSIVEDLGQVGYIFSDKTGTLTRNIMDFKYMLIGNEFYGDEDVFEQTKVAEAQDKWQCPKYDGVMNGTKNATINMKINSQSGGACVDLKTQ